jgi:UDP-GlcNAc:undecaprenyl-phosphate GlcNAc-1-phosphate transferase
MLRMALPLAAAVITALLLRRPIAAMLRRSGLARPNWKGVGVVPSGGVVLALASIAGHSAATALCHGAKDNGLALGLMIAAFVGLFDDIAGRDSGKGFSGHVSESLRVMTVSTGVLKAVFVSLAALMVARTVSKSAWETLLRAGGIALTANFFNLLDLRPGRCIKAYLAVSALGTALAGLDLQRFGPVIVSALVVLPDDLKARTMLGDSGSNLLGFAIGAQIAYAAPMWFVPAWTAIALILNAASEKYSFSSLIESNRLLRWLDMLGRPRN